MHVPQHVSVIPVDEGGVALDRRKGTYFHLNWVAARILDRVGRGEDAETVSRSIVEETGADPAQVLADVEDMVAAFRDQGLLEG